MRFIGNKENLVEKIYQIIDSKEIKGNSFFDFFAGTTSVGQFFKKKNYSVFSSDLLYFSFVLQKANIENNTEPTFEKLLAHLNFKSNLLFSNPLTEIVEYLNRLPLTEGFIYQNYTPEGSKNLPIPRMYFSNENGKIIDTIRLQIEEWKVLELISENEYFILLACLIETVPEILGKKLDSNIFQPFSSVEEVIDFKANMRKAPKGNVPILLTKFDDKIEVSGRLFKSGGLSYDPNIGALSIIAAVLRKLGWQKEIEITQHGLQQKHVGKSNKFIQIANKINISLAELTMPTAIPNVEYWKYDTDGEKLGTIFIHLVVENFTEGYSIFENHAGSEKGYFIPLNGEPIPLAKYKDKQLYKSGNKTQIIHIPDLILIDFGRSEVINIEGKKYKFKQDGIKELKNYDFIEENYVNVYYPKFNIIRTVVLYGSKEEELIEIEIGFLLNENGLLVLGVKAPALFCEAIKNLLDFWK